MAKSVSYAVSFRETNIIQRAFRPEGWYWSRVIWHMIRILQCFIHFIVYLNRRVYRVFIISYISTMPLIIHVFYENFENLEIWNFFAMFYTLYHIFKQESIQSRGTIKGRGMIKGRHLALYHIFKITVFTTKYMIK